MIRFLEDLAVNPLLLSGLVGGALAGLACGVIGPYVITRRIVFLAGAIAHIAVGGIGAVVYLRHAVGPALDWLEPIHGAVVAALLAAVLLGIVQHFARERLDTLIGALWAIGMATGLVLVKITPGYHVELMSYLFGNLAVVEWADARLITVLLVAILVVVAFFHKRILALCLDEEHAHLQGIGVLVTHIVLLALVALAVVALTRVVGLILVIALLSLPAATVAHFTRRMGPMIALSASLCLLLTSLPRMAVYGTRVSPEAAIVLAAGLVYLMALAWERVRKNRARTAGGTNR